MAWGPCWSWAQSPRQLVLGVARPCGHPTAPRGAQHTAAAQRACVTPRPKLLILSNSALGMSPMDLELVFVHRGGQEEGDSCSCGARLACHDP